MELEEAIKRLRKKVEDEKVLGMLAHIDKIVDENILDNIAIETVLQALEDTEKENSNLKSYLHKQGLISDYIKFVRRENK